MKHRFLVWMPPDGDSRAQKWQLDYARKVRRSELLGRPAHALVIPSEVRPRGRLTTGVWRSDATGLYLSLADTLGWAGELRLAEAAEPPLPVPEELPDWTWRRGKLAWLEEEISGLSVIWQWEPVSGWKAWEPKEPESLLVPDSRGPKPQ